AEEMLKALRATPEGGGKMVRRRWGRTAAALVVLGAAVAGGIYGRPFLQESPPEPPAPPIPVAVSPSPVAISPSPVAVDAAVAAVAVDAAVAPAADLAQLPETTREKVEALLESEQLADAERFLL